MKIIASKKDYKSIKKAFDKRDEELKQLQMELIQGNETKITVPQASEQKGEVSEKDWINGKENIINFLANGYFQIKKFCPMLQKECITTKCQWYLVANGTGDCNQNWLFHKR